VLKEMGREDLNSTQRADEAAFWDSFRENSLESPATAVAFFDLVCGENPNWDAPDVPWLRQVIGRGHAIESAARKLQLPTSPS
jgi:hypothetical protein